MLGIDRAAVKIGDLARVGAVGEINHRNAALIPGLNEDIAAGHGYDRAVMRDAVLHFALRGGQLVVAAIHQLAIDNIVDRVRAIFARVLRAAPRARAAAPFVGVEHLGAVIVKGGRMPIGEALVRHRVDALGLARIGYVEDHAIARAGARRDALGRENGNVVALIGPTRVLRTLAMVAAQP